MDIVIDRASPVPLHFQIQQEIEHLIGDGTCPPGLKLPTVQDMATQHSLSTHTVMRAYTSLAKKGLITTSRRRGTFVAEGRVSTTIIVLPPWMHMSSSVFSGQLYQQIIDTIRDAFGDRDRRFSHLKVDGGHYHVREIIEMCELQRADSVVILDPSLHGLQDLPLLAQRTSVVGLFCRGHYAGVIDTVDVDAVGALRTVLSRRLDAGVKHFTFLGFESLLQSREYTTLYQDLYNTFCQTIRSAGIEPQILIVPSATIEARNAALVEQAATIPPDSSVLAIAISVVHVVGPDPQLDMISYTEVPETKLKFADKATLLYAHLPDAVAEAARLLVRKRSNRPGKPLQIMTSLDILDRR